MQPKILVIGSRDHNRATCIDWLQPFPNIEEYQSIWTIVDILSNYYRSGYFWMRENL